MGRPELSTTQTPAPSRLPRETRPHNEDPAPAPSCNILSAWPLWLRCSSPPQREVPSPEPTVQPALAYPNLQGPNSPATFRRYWTKSSNSNIYTFRAKFW